MNFNNFYDGQSTSAASLSTPVTDQQEEAAIRRAVITDSPPLCEQIKKLKAFLCGLGYKVDISYHQSCQSEAECGYRAIVSVYNMSAPRRFLNLKHKFKSVTADQVVKFFNSIIGKDELSEAVWLSDREIRHIVRTIEFLQNNFRMKNILYAHELFRTLKKIKGALNEAIKDVEAHSYALDFTVKHLIHMIDRVKSTTKPGPLQGLLENILNEMNGEHVADYQLLANEYYLQINPLTDPSWFDGVYGYREFKEHIKDTDRPLRRTQSAIVNTRNRPGGQHWFGVTYENTEEQKKYPVVTKAFDE